MLNNKKNSLGRGLSALLDDPSKPAAHLDLPPQTSVGNINHVKITQIEVNPFQPRSRFDDETLQELAQSIRLQGLIQPITVRQTNANTYQLISGERRLRASVLAELTEIPAYIRIANDQQMLEMALIENIQRENLNAIEVSLSFQRMLDECNLKQEELGERVGKNRSTVTNYLRLLKLPPPIQAAIRDGQVMMGHARALVSIDDTERQLAIYQEIIDKGLSVRNVEALVKQHQSGVKSDTKKPSKPAAQQIKIQEDLSARFSAAVRIKTKTKGRGAIEIPFSSEEDLSRILELLDW